LAENPDTTVAFETDGRPRSAPAPAVARRPRHMGDSYWGTGRRKTAIARVRLSPGDGKFLVNDRDVDKYFGLARDRHTVRKPLSITDTAKSYDVRVNVYGGGPTGQAGAIALGLARALAGVNPDFEPKLRDERLLTRDPRKVERKKYGRAGARRRFQFSKR